MNSNFKVALSAVALAAFVAAPAVAKSHTQHHITLAPAYSNNTVAPAYPNDIVVQNGHVLGADPDPGVRLELRRDGRYWLDN
jgi:hypothetical protein